MPLASDTFEFLKDLTAHNNRDWFNANKLRYEAAKTDVEALIKEIEKGLAGQDELEGHKLFRIYRDVRFSKNKAPYKTHFGTYFKRAGKWRRGGYYLHLEPGNSFAGGGFWKPDPQDLKRIRDEFVADAQPMLELLASRKFKQYFGTLQGDEVKTAPKGYSKDHPAIEFIRKKQFLAIRKLTDQEVLSDQFAKEVVNTFGALRPWFDYMSEVLTTNLNGEPIV